MKQQHIMNSKELPDVARHGIVSQPGALDWVGMQGVEMPLRLAETSQNHPVHAHINAQVNLPDPGIKGIHMSRLYLLLDSFADIESLRPASLHDLLREMVNSHHDCGTDSARVSIRFNLLHRRPALLSLHLAGWRSYPVRLDVSLIAGVLQLQLGVSVLYSSTCPCSAALSRQLISAGFMATLGQRDTLSATEVADWLNINSTLATPHSQRSIAEVSLLLPSDATEFGILPLINLLEDSLQTPVQTAVKRVDEQAFAKRNGANLMYVEDAARRLQHAVSSLSDNAEIRVRHLESLHPHDAYAQSRSGAPLFAGDCS